MPGRLLHDVRRTAYRNLRLAGVDAFTAMAICGHKTMSMAMRYSIIDTREMALAMARTGQIMVSGATADGENTATITG